MHMPAPTAEGRTLASLIDHTLLKAEARREDVLRMCREAVRHRFASVCVHPAKLAWVVPELAGTGVKAGTVVGFPFGAVKTATKAFEAAAALEDGAEELDMVLAIGALKDGDTAYARDDIRAVARLTGGRTLKVILETCLLNREEKITACKIVVEAGAQFVKTSTGLAAAGATVEDIRLMRDTVGPAFGVKASGGIRTAAHARAMIEAGANRLGTSAGVDIVTARSQGT